MKIEVLRLCGNLSSPLSDVITTLEVVKKAYKKSGFNGS